MSPTSFPEDRTSFVGRRREIEEVKGLFDRGARLVTLHGAPGVGKSRLLREVGRTMPGLEALDEPEVDVVTRALDRGARVLVASRERMRLSGEAVVPVPPLDERDAVELLRDRARLVAGPGWDTPPEILAEVVARLDGLPLAIELAAERAHLVAPAELRATSTKRRDATGRERCLEDAITASWERLDPRERGALAALSVFVGRFTLDAAQAVLAAEDALDALDELVARSLVVARGGDRPRFQLLSCIRAFAAQRGDATEPARRHADYFLRLPAGEGVDEIDDVLAAHVHALVSDPVAAGRALLQLEPVLGQQRPLAEVAPLLERAAEQVPSGSIKARLLAAHARTLRRMGHEAAAAERLLAARAAAREDGDRDGVALVDGSGPALTPEASTFVFDAVTVSGAVGPALERARRACERTLVSLRRKGSRRSEGVVLTRLASVLLRLGEVDEALGRAEEALAIHHDAGAAAFEGVSAYLAGLAETRLGRAVPAAQRFAEVHARADELDSRLLRGYACHGDGVLAASVGNSALAMADLEAAVAHLADAGDPITRAEAEALARSLALDPGAPAPQNERRSLRVATTWFEIDAAARVDLARRRALRLLVRALAENAVAKPGTALPLASIVAAAWPGERMLATAASARVWTAVRTLRDLGLRDVLVTQDDGYAIAPHVGVTLA